MRASLPPLGDLGSFNFKVENKQSYNPSTEESVDNDSQNSIAVTSAGIEIGMLTLKRVR